MFSSLPPIFAIETVQNVKSVFTVKELCIPFSVFSGGEVGRFSKNEGEGTAEQQGVTKGFKGCIKTRTVRCKGEEK